MKALVIKSKSPSEIKFLSNLLKKLGVSARIIDIEEVEDYGMAVLMKDTDRSKKINRDTILKKLKS